VKFVILLFYVTNQRNRRWGRQSYDSIDSPDATGSLAFDQHHRHHGGGDFGGGHHHGGHHGGGDFGGGGGHSH